MNSPIENVANNNINNSNGVITVLPAVLCAATILALILVKKDRLAKGRQQQPQGQQQQSRVKPIDPVFHGACLRRCAQAKFQLAGHYNASYFNNHSTTPITPSPEANQKWGRHYRKAYMARQKRITLDREYTHVDFDTFSDEIFEKQQALLAIKANVKVAQRELRQELRKAGLSVTAYNRIMEESEEEASDYKRHYTQKACCISTLAVPNVADLLVEYGEELVCQWVHGDKDLIEDAKFHNNMVALKDDVVGLVKAMTAHEKKRVLVADQEPIVVETVKEDDDDEEIQVEKCDDGYGPGAIVVYTPQVKTIVEEAKEEEERKDDQEQVAMIQQQQPCVVIENLPKDMPHSVSFWTGDNACYNQCEDDVSSMTSVLSEDESLEVEDNGDVFGLFVDVVVKDNNQQTDNVVEDNLVEDFEDDYDCDDFSLTAEEIEVIEQYEAEAKLQQQTDNVVEDNVVEDFEDDDDFSLPSLTGEQEAFLARELAKYIQQQHEPVVVETVEEDDNDIAVEKTATTSATDGYGPGAIVLYIASAKQQQREPVVVETVEEDDDDIAVEKTATTSSTDGYGPGAIVLYIASAQQQQQQQPVETVEEDDQQQQQPVETDAEEDQQQTVETDAEDDSTVNVEAPKPLRRSRRLAEKKTREAQTTATTNATGKKARVARKKTATRKPKPSETQQRPQVTRRSGRQAKKPDWFVPF
ncbi:expressed unknown protein [Seminavis robusta]|uniref:Uncharacterized protein n=1 Tax=Seminavis robusta TaxID=568900 RepID=A0A9N8H207_9STRA|nr:expressed unknown protein [Seminavis robusta]|eukprot:Sro54_g031770.1 n/a (699) ;mRNA; r:39456-41747